MSATVESQTSVFGPDIDMMFDRLMQIEGPAEIVDGRIIVMSPTGTWPNLVAGEIYVALRAYARRTKRGKAVSDNAIFRVHLPHRDSFCPDAAYYVGPSAKMGPFQGA